MISKSNVKLYYVRLCFLLSSSKHYYVQEKINKTIDLVLVISRMIMVSRLRLITLTLTLIIPATTKI